MNAVEVKSINDITLYDINTCVAQWTDSQKPDTDEFYVICVWFAEPARRILKRQCADGSYVIFPKQKHQYRMPDIIEKAIDIWEKGYVPIEVIQSEGCLFYGIPKSVIKQRTVRTHSMILMEH